MDIVNNKIVYNSLYGKLEFNDRLEVYKLINDLKDAMELYEIKKYKEENSILIKSVLDDPYVYKIYPYDSKMTLALDKYIDDNKSQGSSDDDDDDESEGSSDDDKSQGSSDDNILKIVDMDASLVVGIERTDRDGLDNCKWKIYKGCYVVDVYRNKYKIDWIEIEKAGIKLNDFEIIGDTWEHGSEYERAKAEIPICLVIGKNAREEYTYKKSSK
jgi:hypothetical protein